MITREGTISGAAAALHLSQPSLSRQMQDLERELGCKLFDRGSRRIELTEAGMRLRRRAEEIVDLVGRTETEFRVSADNLAGEVRIGGGETPGMGLVAQAIAGLQGDYPLMRFSLYSGNAEDVSERLDNGRIDFGVFIGHANLDRYEVLQLPARDVWGAFMRRGRPLGAARSAHARRSHRPAAHPLAPGGPRDARLVPFATSRSLDVVATYNLLYKRLAAGAGTAWATSSASRASATSRPRATWCSDRSSPAATADIFHRLEALPDLLARRRGLPEQDPGALGIIPHAAPQRTAWPIPGQGLKGRTSH